MISLHLLFVDYMLIFRRADPNYLQHLQRLFLCFIGISSLKINLANSILDPVDDVVDVDGLVDILGYEVSPLPLKYLGLPLGPPIRPRLFGTKLLKR